ncbi:sensory rhodopsin transducer [Stutzerimonas stutzeri]|uniref:sensory rhodopsin transducer n=1 Tax=Stutzerimonas stutzeri TaxID=316 RepID=UPI003717E6DE
MKARVCLKTDSGSLWEGYLPAMGPKPDEPAQRSHERGALRNTGPLEAVIDLTLYFADRDPVAVRHSGARSENASPAFR